MRARIPLAAVAVSGSIADREIARDGPESFRVKRLKTGSARANNLARHFSAARICHEGAAHSLKTKRRDLAARLHQNAA
jgi:hypothetical protein